MGEEFILGAIQGVTEWLPVSSEGIIVIVKTNFFHSQEGVGAIKEALFLHLGTFFAALVYFRKEVAALVKTIFTQKGNVPLLRFLLFSTLISGSFGFLLLKLFSQFEREVTFSGKGITLLVGVLLFITGLLQLKSKDKGKRDGAQAKDKDSLVLGLVQGLAVLPGFSRSGLTVSALLLRKFDKKEALKMSFLMSLPIVFGGNILLNYQQFALDGPRLVGLAASFLFGIATINLLLRLAEKTNFGYFVLGFAALTIVSIFF